MKWSVLQLKKLVEIVQQIHQLVEHQKALENERVMVNFKHSLTSKINLSHFETQLLTVAHADRYSDEKNINALVICIVTYVQCLTFWLLS